MNRLLIVSNRLPVSIEKAGEEIIVRQSSGGLVSAIKGCFESGKKGDGDFDEKLWIGSVDSSKDEWDEAVRQEKIPTDFVVTPIFPEKNVYERYYSGFSNSTIWPLFHYFPSLVQYKAEDFAAYIKINKLFADKITEVYKQGDVIWVHDYQLMLLPGMLRKRFPEAIIGFFLHIPFPSYEIFRLLPTEWKSGLLTGILGADLIGFHTHDYVQHFIQSAKMILRIENQFNIIQYNNRLIKTDLFPIGIDYQRFRRAITDDVVVNISTALEERFYRQKIIFSVDRLDYTKGLSYRLKGFEEFLVNYPEWREKVVFVFNIIPSRDAIPEYIRRRKEIQEQVSSINGRFSTLQWQPLIYRYNHLSFEELCALYQSADAALITPLRDGMNLVAKEFIASCIDKGVLILSELTGAASELNEAILVNPTDSTEVADAIAAALTMPLIEQRSRLSYMQRRIAEYNVGKWTNDFLNELITTKKEQQKQKVNLLDEEVLASMIEEFRRSESRCILLDYDGTLAPYQKLPALAKPDEDVLKLLTDLCDDPKNQVVIISGRDVDTLEKWLGHLPLTLVAEHGACIRYKNQSWKEQVSVTPEWKDQVRPLLELFSSRCVGSFIEEKRNTLAWHYRNTHPDLGFIRSRELRNSLLQLTANTPLQVIDGNKVLEIRLVGIDKGATSQKLLAKLSPDFTLCIGDDTTDEDMFRLLRDTAYTIKIGSGSTAAEYTVMSQSEVLPLLKKFLETSVTLNS